MRTLILAILIALSFLFVSVETKASHAAGADISYTFVSGNTYKVTYTFYRDCSGVGAPGNVTFVTSSANAGVNFNTNSTLRTGPTQVVPVCATAVTTCAGGATPGRAQYIYTANITLPSQQTDWIFGVSVNARNAVITTIKNPDSQTLYVEATLNNTIQPGNNAPSFANNPAAFIYLNQTYCYNNGVVDLDGDSLVYSLITPKTSNTINVTYRSPYTAIQPLTSSPAVSFDANTGDVCMTPTALEVTVMAVQVKEYRYGVLIGSVIRDIQISTLAGADKLPSMDGINSKNIYTDTVVVGCVYSFTTKTADADAAQNLTLTSNVATAIPAATFISSGGKTPTGTFTWTPGAGDVGNPKYFTVTVRDDYCNIEGQQVKAFGFKVINLTANFNSTAIATACVGQGVNFYSQWTLSNYSYFWSFGSGSVATYAQVTSANPTGITYTTPGAKTVTLSITTPSGCVVTRSNVITIGDAPTASFTSTAPVCMEKTVDFTNTGSSGAGYTYFWDFGSGASPATSTAENPTGVAYSTSGTKTVTVTIRNQYDCMSTATQSITINATPVASFTSTAPRCTGLAVDFTNTGTTAGVTYAWNFGSGATPATSTSENPTGVTYSTSGIKTVTLTITNSTTSCAVTATNTIAINQTPTVSFTSTAPVCMNTGVNFTNSGSTGGNWSYFWDLGKDAIPATSTSQNPVGVGYSTSGTKTVTFTISDQNCTNTFSNTVTINATPVASFTSTAPRCTGLAVDFTNTGTSAGVTYAWNFGSGATPATSTSENPTGVTYSTSGIKTVTLTTTNTTTGCAVTATNTITINQTPSVSFTSTAPVCINTGVNFTNTGSTGGNWSYFWDLGKDAIPATSTSQNPVGVGYSTSGTKTVTFTISDQNCTNTFSNTVTINATPVASFTSTAPRCTGLAVDFTNTGTSAGVTYAWNFGSGATPATSTSQSPTGVTYSTSGIKTVTLTVTNTTTNCVVTATNTITIYQTPSVSFTSTAPVCINTGVNFTNTGSTGGNWSYFWDLGKDAIPATSTSQNPVGVGYSTSGTKTVTFTISDQNCTNTYSNTVTINATPVASFTSTAPKCTGLNVDFTNTGTTSGVSYAWNFGSGANPATSTSQSPTGVTYSTSGIKTVTLTVTNTTTNCAVTATNTITIYQTPSVSFSSTAPVCVNTGINFTNKGSTGSNWSYNWTFGKDANPSTSSSESPTGVYYINSGTKRVTFTISDQNCTNTYSDTSVVINATPVASFTSTAPRCTGLTVDFTNTGTTNGVTYSWNFGTGATPTISAAQNPTGVVYSTSGIKTVTLTTTNSTTGCAVTATNTITIYQTPSVSFTSSTPVCVSTGANFTNTGSTGINWSYSWSFGKDASPSSSTAESPKGVLFGSGGTKIVTFTISDQNCTNTDSTRSITINALPVVDAGKDTTICANTSVQIGTASVNNYTYSWFPSNTLDNAQIANPTSSPIAPVTKYIVTVTDKTSGCQNTDSVAVTMLTPLIANAGVDVTICKNDSIQIGTGLVKGQTYSWTPVKGINSTVSPNPMVSPDSTTTYTLTVTGANCTSVKDQVTVIVHPLPLANAGKDTMIARGASVQLEATGGTQYVWTPATGLSNAGIYNPGASPLDSTIYKLTVTDVYGCVNSDTMTIKVITPSHWVPSAFTPDNQDNNIFYVRGEGMTNFEFGIFNRWGEQLFYTKDASQGWDGKKQISGEDMPAGAYIYYIKGKTTTGDPINETGLINLIR